MQTKLSFLVFVLITPFFLSQSKWIIGLNIYSEGATPDPSSVLTGVEVGVVCGGVSGVAASVAEAGVEDVVAEVVVGGGVVVVGFVISNVVDIP